MDASSTLINNRYRVVRELGRGGFGATFLVEDTQLPSGKRFVLKELTPIENNGETYALIKQRFEREAVILEELGNINSQIPSLYAYFTEASKFYLVQEYIEGETLSQRVMSQGLMSNAAVREWLLGILPVLACVHDKRIVHRDVKPDNIMLRQRDHMAVLIDFGAVRETMGTQVNAQGKSTQSIVIGTPGFMASEQSIGRAVFASDLYSLGLTAIYTLTGKIPQELPTDPMTGEIQWRQFAPTVSTGLAHVIDKAIALGVQGRFQTAQQMLDALMASDAPSGIPGTVMSMPSNAMPSHAVPSQGLYAPMSGAMPTVVDPSANYSAQPQYPQQPQPQSQPQYPQPQYPQSQSQYPQQSQYPPQQPQSQYPQQSQYPSQPQPQSQYPQQSQYPPQQPQSQYPPQQPPQYSQQPQSQYPSQQSGYPQSVVQPVTGRKVGGIPIAAAAIAAGLFCIGLGVMANQFFSSKSCDKNQEKVDGKCVDVKKAGTSEPSGSGTSETKTFKDVPNVPGLTVRYGGSTSFAPVRSPEFVSRIQQAHPKFILSYTKPIAPDKPGSGNGIKMLLEGQMSVAESSRALKDEEYAQAKERGFTLEQIPVAFDGIAIYVNPQLSVTSLTLAQIKDIFTGQLTNWKDLGGPDIPITAISRDPKDGGTPEYFEDKVMGKKPKEKTSFALAIQDSYAPTTTESLRRVGASPGGIGYASAAEVCNQSTVKTLAIPKESGQPVSPCKGREVSKSDFANDAYPITRRLFVIVRKDGKLDEQAGMAYANLLLSGEGQDAMEKLGMVPFKTR